MGKFNSIFDTAEVQSSELESRDEEIIPNTTEKEIKNIKESLSDIEDIVKRSKINLIIAPRDRKEKMGRGNI